MSTSERREMPAKAGKSEKSDPPAPMVLVQTLDQKTQELTELGRKLGDAESQPQAVNVAEVTVGGISPPRLTRSRSKRASLASKQSAQKKSKEKKVAAPPDSLPNSDVATPHAENGATSPYSSSQSESDSLPSDDSYCSDMPELADSSSSDSESSDDFGAEVRKPRQKKKKKKKRRQSAERRQSAVKTKPAKVPKKKSMSKKAKKTPKTPRTPMSKSARVQQADSEHSDDEDMTPTLKTETVVNGARIPIPYFCLPCKRAKTLQTGILSDESSIHKHVKTAVHKKNVMHYLKISRSNLPEHIVKLLLSTCQQPAQDAVSGPPLFMELMALDSSSKPVEKTVDKNSMLESLLGISSSSALPVNSSADEDVVCNDLGWDEWTEFERTGQMDTPARCVPCNALLMYDHNVLSHARGSRHKLAAKREYDSVKSDNERDAKSVKNYPSSGSKRPAPKNVITTPYKRSAHSNWGKNRSPRSGDSLRQNDRPRPRVTADGWLIFACTACGAKQSSEKYASFHHCSSCKAGQKVPV